MGFWVTKCLYVELMTKCPFRKYLLPRAVTVNNKGNDDLKLVAIDFVYSG